MARTFTMTVASVLTKARRLANDSNEELGLRDSDADCIGYLNEAILAMVPLVPGLFAAAVTHTCTAGARQDIEADRAVAYLDLPGLNEGDLATLNAFAPGWTAAAAAVPREFMRLPGEPLAFMTYPPATAGAQLTLRIVRSPEPLDEEGDTDQLIALPEVYEPSLVEYVVGRAEVKDDEHVNSNRAAQLLERFTAGVKALATP